MSYSTSNSQIGSFYNGYTKSTTTNSTSYSKLSEPEGLENLTNTCYISAVLQILFLFIDEKMFPVKSLKLQPVTYWFFQLKKSHQKKDYEEFKQALQQKVQIVKGWDQQDAQQLMIGVLEQISIQNPKELRKGKIDLSYKQKMDFEQNWKCFQIEMQKIQRSDIVSLMYGEILRKFTCPKEHQKYTFQRYQQLSLSFPEAKKSQFSSYSSYSSQNQALKLQDMYYSYLGEQLIQEVMCETCKGKKTFKKLSILFTIPKYLTFHLVRFKKSYYYDQEKINSVVEFDEYMELQEKNGKKKSKLKLIGIVNHYGTLHKGHYEAQVCYKGNWFQIDDEKVRPCKIQKRGNSSKYVYMLVYQKIE